MFAQLSPMLIALLASALGSVATAGASVFGTVTNNNTQRLMLLMSMMNSGNSSNGLLMMLMLYPDLFNGLLGNQGNPQNPATTPILPTLPKLPLTLPTPNPVFTPTPEKYKGRTPISIKETPNYDPALPERPLGVGGPNGNYDPIGGLEDPNKWYTD